MYSYEQHKKAVELYIKYQSWSAVIRELGYPDRKTLRQWYSDYINNTKFPERQKSRYSEEQIQTAVNHYLEHGKCISRTVRFLGYPCRYILGKWLYERVPEYRGYCRTSKTLVHLSQRQKIEATIDFRTRECSAEVSILSKESAELQKRNYRLRLENDVLEKAAEILKKGQGITLQTLTNHEKTMVIDALREQHRLKELLSVFHMAKSSYCYQKIVLRKVDKYSDVRELVHKSFSRSGGCYGYRRI